MERKINVELEDESFSSGKSIEVDSHTPRQWLVLLLLGSGNLLAAACISLQAPFFPKENQDFKIYNFAIGTFVIQCFFSPMSSFMAESKDITPKEYGFFFGAYYFTSFTFSIVCAKLLTFLNPRVMFNSGIFSIGVCYVFFGLLHHCSQGWLYETLTFAVRLVEGIGSAACKTACTTIIMAEFPNSVPSAFASIETYFGVGLLLGPVVGGAIYENKGYSVPFTVFGIGLIICTLISLATLPSSKGDIDDSVEPIILKSESVSVTKSSLGAVNFLCHGDVLLQICSVVCATMCVGYNQTALEPHLRQFSLRPVAIGLVFVVSGGLYALSSPVFGSLCEQQASPKVLSAVGCILITLSFLFIGPVSFIQIQTQLWMIIFSLVIFGIGLGATLVSGFVDVFRETKKRGFPNELATYALASCLFSAAVSFGYFAGPSVGGFLLETVGYRQGTVYFLLAECVLVCLFSLTIICENNEFDKKKTQMRNEKSHLLIDVSASYDRSTFYI